MEGVSGPHGRGEPHQTVLMPSIGLMSPTKFSRSVIVNRPSSRDGSSGFHVGPLCQR